MSDQYVGEIRMFAGDYAPEGWHLCDGTLLNIGDNELLYTLIGTTYGGDGRSTFGIPDLRGRIPVHTSPAYPLGQKAGTETVTLTQANLPSHTHVARANNNLADATSNSPTNHYWGITSGITNYSSSSPNTTFSSQAISTVGGSEPHNNIMPSLTVNFIIAVNGLYPSQG